MFLHITFEDGSNPYVKYGNQAELSAEIERWKSNFYLIVNRKATGYNAYAMRKPGLMFGVTEGGLFK